MKRALFASTAALLLALAACDTPNDPRVEATDGFGSNTLDVYTVVSSGGNGWSIDGGELIGTGPVTHSLLLWNGIAFDDGWVEAESRRADDAGLVLRWVDNLNYYVLAFRDDGAPGALGTKNLEIMKRTGGTFQSLWSKDVTWPRNTMHKVRFEAAGGRLIAYFDGTAQGEVTDAVTAGIPGQFGLRHHGADATWVSTFDVFRWHVPLAR
jgi:hypothetical protein